jgi:hypothetical protein
MDGRRELLRKKFKELSKSRLILFGSMVLGGSYLEALGGEKSSIYMQIGGAALIMAGGASLTSNKHKAEDKDILGEEESEK